MFKLLIYSIAIFFNVKLLGQSIPKSLNATKTNDKILLDGILNEPTWQLAKPATDFTTLRPAPFIKEIYNNRSEVYILYNNEGMYIGGNFYESNVDSIAKELVGRDGFGNNDFVGIVFDTYQDKLNGFEYFVTPLGEQMDAKIAPGLDGGGEDFNWNAVWQASTKINSNGWSFEIFLPFAAIRFGKKTEQNWGLNIIRKRIKSGQDLFWNPINPNVNGFLTQEGTLTGLKNLKPPIRLQLSPYFSIYNDKIAGSQKYNPTFTGGADIKYGLNQAFTLDMTLIPDFGQVVTDNRVLNLSPFEVQFNENRTFFTEGTELFGKGNLFYSRRIGNLGNLPSNYFEAVNSVTSDETMLKNPTSIKLLNASKVSGRTQKGLGLGFLNAVTASQNAIIQNNITGQTRKFLTEPLTNYNVFVLDQTMKNNSSISFINTNVLRNGNANDANVSAFIFDLNDKTNSWNIGGNLGVSKIVNPLQKTPMGYKHSLYFGKTSGQYNFNFWQDAVNNNYDNSDLGYFTNNNQLSNGFWHGYNWIKPTKWYNSLNFNNFFEVNSLITHFDSAKTKGNKFMGVNFGARLGAQLKNLWRINFNINGISNNTDFYEPRVLGQYFKQKATIRYNLGWGSNNAKKLSWGGNTAFGFGGIFKQKQYNFSLYGKIRFSSKLSVDHYWELNSTFKQAGFAAVNYGKVFFSKRNLQTVENLLNVKYSFTNRMGATIRARHYFSKVNPIEFFELNNKGKLITPTSVFTQNVKQNYNFFSVDMVYTWQFAQGSFINVVWKNIGENFERNFQKNYFNNVSNILNNSQSTSISLRVIYFLDYNTVKSKLKKA
jgi:hypothetical protein